MERWGKCTACKGTGKLMDVDKGKFLEEEKVFFIKGDFYVVNRVYPSIDCEMCDSTGRSGDAMDYYKRNVL